LFNFKRKENKGTDSSKKDLEKLQNALQAISQNDFVLARQLLKEIVANAPMKYEYSYRDQGALIIRFWTNEEFLQHATETEDRKDIVWEQSIYPPAYYYLAVIDVHEGKYESAISNLQKSLKLEPDQPLSFCELGYIMGGDIGEHELSLEFYERALTSRPHITTSAKARALRGKGVQLIELGRLEKAEVCLQDSLRLEPDNELAYGELIYISKLKSGEDTSPIVGLEKNEVTESFCSSCGKELGSEGTILNKEGKLIYLCKICGGTFGR
jgi:tetratricopeptide (TPR) repeat protein